MRRRNPDNRKPAGLDIGTGPKEGESSEDIVQLIAFHQSELEVVACDLPPAAAALSIRSALGTPWPAGESVTPSKQVEEEIAVLDEEWSEQLRGVADPRVQTSSPGCVTAPMIEQDRGEGPGPFGTVEQCPQLETSAVNHNGVRPRCLCHDPATQRQAQTIVSSEEVSLPHLDRSNGPAAKRPARSR